MKSKNTLAIVTITLFSLGGCAQSEEEIPTVEELMATEKGQGSEQLEEFFERLEAYEARKGDD